MKWRKSFIIALCAIAPFTALMVGILMGRKADTVDGKNELYTDFTWRHH